MPIPRVVDDNKQGGSGQAPGSVNAADAGSVPIIQAVVTGVAVPTRRTTQTKQPGACAITTTRASEQPRQVFRATVPAGLSPGSDFVVMAGSRRVRLRYPHGVRPGQQLQFSLPAEPERQSTMLKVAPLAPQSLGEKKLIPIDRDKIKEPFNEEDSSLRVFHISPNPSLFQSLRLVAGGQEKEEPSNKVRDHPLTRLLLYVRKLTLLEEDNIDPRMRTGACEMIRAHEAILDSYEEQEVIANEEISSIHKKTTQEKITWFGNLSEQWMMAEWENGGIINLSLRKSHLLEDSVNAVMSLGRDDMRKAWRLDYLDRRGICEGSAFQDWFKLVSREIFHPKNGLWLPWKRSMKRCMTINPKSEISCPAGKNHLVYYRFFGRIMGRALCQQGQIEGYLAPHLYKHLLGWPIGLDDLEIDDETFYRSVQELIRMDDVSTMCLNFTATNEPDGREVELVEGGSRKDVTNDNFTEYLGEILQYRLCGRIKPQLTELLLGFFDVISPEPLAVFDPDELEQWLCGHSRIFIPDWQAHTVYSGLFEEAQHQVITWFWEAISEDFDEAMRIRLVEFVTGAPGVLRYGFAELQGYGGKIQKFTIHGVNQAKCPFPRAHTSSNRIDLPAYQTKKELVEKLKSALWDFISG